MLRKIILPLILLQLASLVLYAQETQDPQGEIWIDFGKLPSGYLPTEGQPYVRQYDPAPIQEGDSTVVDYSNLYDPSSGAFKNMLPSRFSVEEYEQMKVSLALDRWRVKLSSSSNFLENRNSTRVVAYQVKETSSRFAGEQLMAVTFTLPTLRIHSQARIVPEFVIPAYSLPIGADLQQDISLPATQRMGQFLGKGVLRNVGPIRSIIATVYGRRFPISLTIEADHSDIGKKNYPMGSLQFSGWQDMIWNNANYIEDVRKRSYTDEPDYPRGMPSMVLSAIRLDRTNQAVDATSSQVVFYIKEVRVVYDKDVSEKFDSEIDDEQIWLLNTINSQVRSYNSARQYRTRLVDQYVELQNRAQNFPAQDTNGGGNNAPPAQPAGN